MPLASGKVTFLFTDIEGSTQRWERDREAMRKAVRRHDAILHDVITSNGGSVFKTVGDAFCASFSDARAAVNAALAIERGLSREDFAAVGDLRVRVALHAGTADERDGDYFGPAVNRVARLLALAHGGQILLSGDAAALVGPSSRFDLRDLGKHRLKDIPEPMTVFQIEAADLPSEFPALRSQGSAPNNLPNQITPFVGREREVADIVELVRAHRLVSLLGTGGIGKTRLALAAGVRLLEAFDDGVWFVDLAPVVDPTGIDARIAAALGLGESPNVPIEQTLRNHLRERNALVVLDNCEHLIGSAAACASALLGHCPSVSILATSREPLAVAGEQAYRTPPLDLEGSMAFFEARAREADRRFELNGSNAALVEAICRRLDGIALAIELAAARLRMLSLKSLAEKLDERFRVLAGGSRTALPRQQTLRALIDWSYDLLADRERVVFRRLSMFAGGFTLELAARVCSGDDIDELEILDLLTSLADKSLIQAEASLDERRYRLLESTREYAREKLRDVGEEDAIASRHAVALAELAERLEADWERTPDAQWTAQAKPELDNWRLALDYGLLRRADVALGQRTAAALRHVWSRLGPSEGRHWIEVALSSVEAGAPPQVVASLHLSLAHLALLVLDYRAVLLAAERAATAFADAGDARGVAESEYFAGSALCMLGETESGESRLGAALETFRRLDVKRLIAATLQVLAIVRVGENDVDRSRELLAEALEIYRSIPGSERSAAHLALNLAEAEFAAGDASTALRLAMEALETDRAFEDRNSTIFDLNNVAAYLIALDRPDEALAAASEALALSEGSIAMAVAWSLQHIAAAAIVKNSGRAEAGGSALTIAAQLLGFVDRQIGDIGVKRDYTERQEYERALGLLAPAVGTSLPELFTKGSAWTHERAFAEAASLNGK